MNTAFPLKVTAAKLAMPAVFKREKLASELKEDTAKSVAAEKTASEKSASPVKVTVAKLAASAKRAPLNSAAREVCGAEPHPVGEVRAVEGCVSRELRRGKAGVTVEGGAEEICRAVEGCGGEIGVLKVQLPQRVEDGSATKIEAQISPHR